MKNKRFLLYLAVAVIVFATLRSIFVLSVGTIWWMHLIELCFYLSPALMVWGAERTSLKNFCIDYQLNFKGICWKTTLRYIFATAFLYPLLIFVFVYLIGNLLGDSAAVRIVEPAKDFTYMGIAITNIPILRSIILWLLNVVVALCYGVTLGSISVWAEEIGWRGFLERNLNSSPYIRPIVIGLIWSVWGVPFIFFGINNSFIQSLNHWIYFAVFNIVLSFYLSEVVRKANSIWASAAIRGIIASCVLSLVSTTNNNPTYFFVTLASLLCVWGITNRLKMIKEL